MRKTALQVRRCCRWVTCLLFMCALWLWSLSTHLAPLCQLPPREVVRLHVVLDKTEGSATAKGRHAFQGSLDEGQIQRRHTGTPLQTAASHVSDARHHLLAHRFHRIVPHLLQIGEQGLRITDDKSNCNPSVVGSTHLQFAITYDMMTAPSRGAGFEGH